MLDKAPRTVHVKWIRSGIGFSYRQKVIVQSLGLRRLNEVVERPDTPQIRGLVAKVSHLVAIVNEPGPKTGTSLPEYTVYAREAVPAGTAEASAPEGAVSTESEPVAAQIEPAAPAVEHAEGWEAQVPSTAQRESKTPERPVVAKKAKPPQAGGKKTKKGEKEPLGKKTKPPKAGKK